MKVVSIVGARPQFVKCAAVSRRLRQVATEILVHTGQHYDTNMSDVFFEELAIPRPDHSLGVGSGPHGAQTGEMLSRIEQVLVHERPDWVLVFGDTNSTLAGALAAAKLHIPVAHVEAGLRSFNRRMPEEINRVVTDHLSSWLFCPSPTAVANLAREGIVRGVELVGDVMLDVLRAHLEGVERRSRILDRLGLRPRGYLLATVHRAENTDDGEHLGNIVKAFVVLAASSETVVFAVHPRTRTRLESLGLNAPPGLRLIDPVSYMDMLALERQAKVILTDSGGVQKEAYWCGVPCVTLREETEWVETVQEGWNVLVGTEPDRIVAAVRSAVAPANRGDGPEASSAAERIVEALLGRDPMTTPAASAPSAGTWPGWAGTQALADRVSVCRGGRP